MPMIYIVFDPTISFRYCPKLFSVRFNELQILKRAAVHAAAWFKLENMLAIVTASFTRKVFFFVYEWLSLAIKTTQYVFNSTQPLSSGIFLFMVATWYHSREGACLLTYT